MRKADMVSAVILLGLALLAVVGTLELPYWSDVSPGPAFASRWVGVIAAVLGVLLLGEAATRTDASVIEWPERDGARRVLLTCVLLSAFGLLLPYAGFALAGVAFMLAMLLGVQRCPLLPSLLATVITIAGCYGIFIGWLQVKLPLGPWGI